MQSHFSIPALLAVAGGGAAGSVARYVIGTMVQRTAGFPYGTLAVNVSGSFVLGLLVTWFVARAPAPELRLLLTIGLCGGYTTFSTFAYESALMLEDGRTGRVAAYILLSVTLSIGAMFAGFGVARTILVRS